MILNLLKLLTFFVMFISSYPAFSTQGKVIKMRGKALALFPSGKVKKQLLKVGSIVKGNALIKTAKKSFVKIQFPDESVIMVGPSSKVAISQSDPKKPKFIELVKGKIRGVVKNDGRIPKGHDHKMYIQSRSASLGVRGTDFYLSYNDKNYITSNVTLKGDVHIYKKTDEEIHESVREEFDGKQVIRFGQGRHVKNTEDQLSHHTSKSIKKGQFSGAFPSYEKPLTSVRISQAQTVAMLNDDSMGTAPRGKVLKGNYEADNNADRNATLVPQPYGETPKKSSKKKDIAQYDGVKPGGIVDLNSGIYIAPPEDAKYDKKTGLFIMPDGLGGIDASTGEYVPPEGIELNPLKGFVVSSDKKYGDRNIKGNLEKLKNLTGPINEQLAQALKIFKEISRADLFLLGNFGYTKNVVENYYGQWINITNKPSYMYDMRGFFGFQLYHDSKHLIYPKSHIRSKYYNNNDLNVKRNDTYEGMLGWEYHYKHVMFGKKARLIFDFEFKTQYLDYRLRDKFDFYTEDTGIRISERFKFNKNNTMDLYYQAREFQGHVDRNHGNIHNVGFNHRTNLGATWDVLYGFEYSNRKEKATNDRFTIRNAYLKWVIKDIIFRTNFTFGYTWQRFNSKLDILYDKANYYMGDLKLERRLGDFWKINLTYEYSRQQTRQEKSPQQFLNQSLLGGLTMVF